MQVTSKGQVTIPRNIREKYGINEDTQVDFVDENGRIYLEKRPGSSRVRERMESLRGSADTTLSTDEIMKLTRGDR